MTSVEAPLLLKPTEGVLEFTSSFPGEMKDGLESSSRVISGFPEENLRKEKQVSRQQLEN